MLCEDKAEKKMKEKKKTNQHHDKNKDKCEEFKADYEDEESHKEEEESDIFVFVLFHRQIIHKSLKGLKQKKRVWPWIQTGSNAAQACRETCSICPSA